MVGEYLINGTCNLKSWIFDFDASFLPFSWCFSFELFEASILFVVKSRVEITTSNFWLLLFFWNFRQVMIFDHESGSCRPRNHVDVPGWTVLLFYELSAQWWVFLGVFPFSVLFEMVLFSLRLLKMKLFRPNQSKLANSWSSSCYQILNSNKKIIDFCKIRRGKTCLEFT